MVFLKRNNLYNFRKFINQFVPQNKHQAWKNHLSMPIKKLNKHYLKYPCDAELIAFKAAMEVK